MTHSFQRYTAAGNTFIVMNTWEDPLSLSREQMRALVRIACDYKNGIGADGMILINQPRGARAGQPVSVGAGQLVSVGAGQLVSAGAGQLVSAGAGQLVSAGAGQPGTAAPPADFRMDFYNPDGTTGMLCGNGARCAVEAARAFHFVVGSATRFEVLGAINRGEILPNGAIRVYFQDPVDIRLNLELPLEAGATVMASYVDLGSQHAVVFFEDLKKRSLPQMESGSSLEDFPIAHYGALVRWHPEFAPVGVNANFIEVREDGEEQYLRIRTFERGVEGETQACGTGCMSSAIVARLTGRISKLPIRLLTQSGEYVTVNFSANGELITGLSLEGPVVTGESGTLIFDEEQHSLDVEYL